MTAPAATALGDELATSGYAIRPVLPQGVIDDVLARLATLGAAADAPVYRTFTDDGREQARQIDLHLKSALAPSVDALLPDHEIVLATYVVKAGHGPPIDWHQDWTFTDERHHRSILLWIPLVDTDAQHGGLGVIPGSHRWTDGIRTSSHTREGPTVPHQEALAAAAVIEPLAAGTAVVYDPATVHGSEANRHPAPRPALIVITGPRGAPVLHFCEEEGTVSGYEVDESFFTTSEFESQPTGVPSFAPWAPAVSADDFVGPLAALGLVSPVPVVPPSTDVTASGAAPDAAPGPNPRLDGVARAKAAVREAAGRLRSLRR